MTHRKLHLMLAGFVSIIVLSCVMCSLHAGTVWEAVSGISGIVLGYLPACATTLFLFIEGDKIPKRKGEVSEYEKIYGDCFWM